MGGGAIAPLQGKSEMIDAPGLRQIDMTQFLPMKPSEFNISISVEIYDGKTARNDRNCYFAEKRIVSKLTIEYIDPKF